MNDQLEAEEEATQCFIADFYFKAVRESDEITYMSIGTWKQIW